MTKEEWAQAGHPIWTCRICKIQYCTIPVAEDFVCPLCIPEEMIKSAMCIEDLTSALSYLFDNNYEVDEQGRLYKS